MFYLSELSKLFFRKYFAYFLLSIFLIGSGIVLHFKVKLDLCNDISNQFVSNNIHFYEKKIEAFSVDQKPILDFEERHHYRDGSQNESDKLQRILKNNKSMEIEVLSILKKRTFFENLSFSCICAGCGIALA